MSEYDFLRHYREQMRLLPSQDVLKSYREQMRLLTSQDVFKPYRDALTIAPRAVRDLVRNVPDDLRPDVREPLTEIEELLNGNRSGGSGA